MTERKEKAMDRDQIRSALRSSNIPAEAKRFESATEEVQSAISILVALLHYHKRLAMVDDPNFMADIYELALNTAIKCLKEKMAALEEQKR